MEPQNHQSGFTLLELIITVALVSVLFVGFFEAFSAFYHSWRIGTNAIRLARSAQEILPAIQNSLHSSQKIIAVSLSTNSAGFIQFKDRGTTITVFLNTNANQATFGENTLPATALVAKYATGGSRTSYDLLLTDITNFRVITYLEVPRSIQVVSPNNTTAPVTLDHISSIRFVITMTREGTSLTRQQLITLQRTPIETASTLEYGVDYNAVNAFPFAPSGGISKGVLTLNVSAVSDTGSGIADGIRLTPETTTVKIRNSGLYFTSIQAAINAAVSGDEVLVAKKNSDYVESITMKSGVTVLGGFDPINWTRDISLYATTIRTKAGVSSRAVTMRSNSTLDGFTIDGSGLDIGVFANAAVGFNVRQCAISNAQTGILILASRGTIQNCSVQVDGSPIQIENSGPGIFLTRNRFLTTNTADSVNVQITNCTNVQVRNNIILGGYVGIQMQGTSGPPFATYTIANNLIGQISGIGVSGTNAIFLIENNVVFKTNVGTYMNPAAVSTITYNLFADNRNGPTTGKVSLDASNIIDSSSYSDWGVNDPYFLSKPHYQLHPNSPIIDAGNPLSSFNDLYVAGQPARGSGRNDIGPYGGPSLGRIGQGNVVRPTTAEEIVSQATVAWPGDYIRVTAGTWTLGSTIIMRSGTTISGDHASLTKLQSGGGTLLNLAANDISVADMTLICEGNVGIEVNGNNQQLKSLIIRSASQGVVGTQTRSTIAHCTFVGNTTGILYSTVPTAIFLNRNLITGGNTGIHVVSGTPATAVTATATGFFGNTTNTIGPITLNGGITSDPQFWNASNQNYFLKPTSPAINVLDHWDLGALEFFVNVGTFSTPEQITAVPTQLKAIQMVISGDPGSVPILDAVHSEIEVATILNGIVTTLNPTIVLNDSVKHSVSWSLPATYIAKKWSVRTKITSYRNRRTPYVNSLKIFR